MGKPGWFLLGVAAAVLAAVIGGYLMLFRARGFSAAEQPTAVERWLATRMRLYAMPADAKAKTNPLATSPEMLAEARAHWADHCATCHANDGSGDTQIGKHSYPPAPDMRLADTQKLTDGQLFYIIQNGIRMTAMPAWSGGGSHDEQDSWKLVLFIRHLPDLTFEEKKEMESLNPKSPEDLKEEQEEQKFLQGDDDNHDAHQHHHH
jgi:mono/diheme cytochrome c family protein